MKKIHILNIAIILLVGLFISDCSSPLDVPANRVIKKDNEPGIGDEIFALSTNNIEFYFLEPFGSETQKFEIRNLLKENYTINSIAFKNSEKFLTMGHHPTPKTLAPISNVNDSKEIVFVTFQPTEPGEFIDTIFINGMISPFVRVQATVVTLRVPEINFIDVPIGNSRNMRVKIKNYGNTTAILDNPIITDADGVFEMELITFPLYIPKGTDIEFSVTFTPNESKSYSGKIEFNIQASGIVDNVCELSGNGIGN